MTEVGLCRTLPSSIRTFFSSTICHIGHHFLVVGVSPRKSKVVRRWPSHSKLILIHTTLNYYLLECRYLFIQHGCLIFYQRFHTMYDPRTSYHSTLHIAMAFVTLTPCHSWAGLQLHNESQHATTESCSLLIAHPSVPPESIEPLIRLDLLE